MDLEFRVSPNSSKQTAHVLNFSSSPPPLNTTTFSAHQWSFRSSHPPLYRPTTIFRNHQVLCQHRHIVIRCGGEFDPSSDLNPTKVPKSQPIKIEYGIDDSVENIEFGTINGGEKVIRNGEGILKIWSSACGIIGIDIALRSSELKFENSGHVNFDKNWSFRKWVDPCFIMLTVLRNYDIQTYATPRINPPLLVPAPTPALIEIHVSNLVKLHLRTRQGNVESNYPTLAFPDIQHDFAIPLQLLPFSISWDPYIFNQLSSMRFDPELCNSMKGRIISSLSSLIIEYGVSLGFQVIVDLKITSTIEFISTQSRDDMMMSMLAADGVVIVEDDGGSVDETIETMRTRRGVSKAAIDGLKKVVVFNGEGDDEKCITCPVCLEECGDGTELTSLPCSHLFHHRCIVPWLKSHNSCPMCRSVVPV
ncbi:unnamed protein product [Camellia sinensis]